MAITEKTRKRKILANARKRIAKSKKYPLWHINHPNNAKAKAIQDKITKAAPDGAGHDNGEDTADEGQPTTSDNTNTNGSGGNNEAPGAHGDDQEKDATT